MPADQTFAFEVLEKRGDIRQNLRGWSAERFDDNICDVFYASLIVYQQPDGCTDLIEDKQLIACFREQNGFIRAANFMP